MNSLNPDACLYFNTRVPFAIFIECAISFLLLLSFTQGIWQAINVPEGIPKVAIEILSLLLLAAAVWHCRTTGDLFQGGLFLIPLGVAAISGTVSGWLNGSSVLEHLFFLRTLLFPIILFLAALNLPINAASIKRLSILTAVLVFVQIPIFAWKWYAVGIDEKLWIGSLSQSAGQLGLLFPMLTLAILLPKYLHSGQKKLALFILVFSFLPIINEKRAAILAIPALFIFSVGLYFIICAKRRISLTTKKWALSRLPILILATTAVWIGAITLIPSLQCEEYRSCHKQTKQYISEYLNRDYSSPLNASRMTVEENTNIQLGRLELIRASLKLLIDHGALATISGFGAGAINPSPHLGANRSDILYDKFGLRGTYPSAMALLLEAGMLAVLSMLCFFCLLLMSVMRRVRQAENENQCLHGLGIALMISVMGFDYFIYSITSWTTHTVAPVFFILLGGFLATTSQEVRYSLVPRTH